MPYDNGYPKGSLTIDPVAFAYCDIANIGNKHDLNYSKKILGSMPYLVISEPGELNTAQSRVAEYISMKGTKIFGYVHVGPNSPGMDKILKSIDHIATSRWYGVFIDQFGINQSQGETRAMHNAIIDYAHDNNLVCFVNATHLHEAFENYKIEGFNPKGIKSHLRSGDWWLAESFLVSSERYYADIKFFEKYIKAIEYQKSLGIKVAALSYKPYWKNWDESLSDIQMSFILALCLGYDGWWMQESIQPVLDPVIDKANRDQLVYAKDFPVDIGTKIIKPLYKAFNNQYIAITDKYRIVFTPADFESYKAPSMQFFPIDMDNLDDHDLALGKKVYASSVEFNLEHLQPQFAVDGLTDTRWSSSYTDSEWIYVDLGKNSRINTIILDWDTARASSYEILISNDTVVWTKIIPSKIVNLNHYSDPKIPHYISQRDMLFFDSLIGRYVKINGLTRFLNSGGYSINNVEVYGSDE